MNKPQAMDDSSRFLIHKRIGRGSFGAVYSGLDLKTHHVVALKIEKSRKSSSLLKEAMCLS